MSSRIDVELTSARPDGTWTWRAAGAREPKGVVESSVLPDGAKVGDVYKVEATIALDGIEIHSVVPGRTGRKEPERLEILGGGEFQAVTTSLVGRRDGGDRSRGDRRDRGDRKDRGERRPGDRGDRRDRPPGDRRPSDRRPSHPSGERASDGADRARPSGPEGDAGPSRPRRERRDRPTYAPVPEVPQRPKPKRLKPGRQHRQALMETLPDEHRPIADQLFRGGLPSVRQALKDQNAALAAEGKPEIKTTGIESLAQDLLPRVRVAEWLDRADAAKATIDDLDLRDLRSVVTAAADPMVARDDTTRELAAELREALERRQNEEHEQWLADITAALDVGRVVRALRLSSRPPKAGVRFPPELGTRLAEATTASLTADAASDRWVAVVEALAFAPVHAVVTPAAPPTAVSDDLRAMVKGVAPAVPQIATLLGIEVPPPGSRPARAPRPPRRPAAKPKPKPPPTQRAPKPEPESESAEAAEAVPPAVEPAAEAEPVSEAEPAVEPASRGRAGQRARARRRAGSRPSRSASPSPPSSPAAEAEPVSEPEPAVEPAAEAEPVSEPEPAVEPAAEAEPAAEPRDRDADGG